MSTTTPPDWEVYAICYGYTAHLPASRAAIGADPTRSADIAYYIWLLKRPGRTVLVDTGYNASSGARRGHDLPESPADLLRHLDVEPSGIRTVVLTHLHYDHAGNLADYPDATFHAQSAEIGFATGRDMRWDFFRSMYEAADVAGAVELHHAGRLELHDGDWAVEDGVTAHLSPGHTPGVQFLRIRTRSGWLVLASDACHYDFLREKEEVYPVVWSPPALLDGYARLTRLASASNLVIPGHDPSVLDRFPAATDALRGRAVRLD